MSIWTLQSIRFGIVGLTSNVVLYLFFLGLTALGLDPKLVITFSYAIGIIGTFMFNKQWSFSHQNGWRRSLMRFLFLYGLLYAFNLIILFVMVDTFQFSHAFVQVGVFVVYVPIVFFIQRYWVFRNNSAVSF